MINLDEISQFIFCVIELSQIDNGMLREIQYYYLRKIYISVINCDFYYYN